MTTARNPSVEPAVSASGEVTTLLIEKMTGKIHEAKMQNENLMRYFDVQDVTGTDRVGEKFMGDTELEVLAPGQAPKGNPVEFDKNTLVVDTVVIGRNTTRLLSDIQNDIDGLHSKLAKQQANKHGKLEDEMIIQQLIASAFANYKSGGAMKPASEIDSMGSGRTRPRVSGMGYSTVVQTKAAVLADPEGIEAAIELALEAMLDGRDGGDGIDLSGLTILMPWVDFNCLRDAERICNADYSLYSGETVSGFVLKSFNVPVIPTNRMPRAAGKSLLSKETNGNRYDITATMPKVHAIIFGTEALLVGKSLDLQSDIWFHKDTKNWIVDSWQSEGAIASMWEQVGVVVDNGTTAGTHDAEVVKRANRKGTRSKGALAA